MDLEKRMTALENLVTSIMVNQNSREFYINSDVAGVRKGVSDITPYTETKKAYIDETEIVFDNVPSGNLTVYFDKSFNLEREGNKVTLHFEALEEVTEITISII